MTTFFTPGTPRPQGSKRYVGNGRSVEASKYLAPWRKSLIASARQAHKGEPWDGPLKVEVVFIMPKPKRPTYEQPLGAPDTDKLQRAVGDALEQAGVVVNDSRIMVWVPVKRYPVEGEVPGAWVRVSRAVPEDWAWSLGWGA